MSFQMVESLTLLFFFISQPNARKEDLFGRPSQGLYSSSYMASKGLTDLTVDMNCLQVNMAHILLLTILIISAFFFFKRNILNFFVNVKIFQKVFEHFVKLSS